MSYLLTKGLVLCLCFYMTDVNMRAEISDNIALTLASVYKYAKEKKWDDICEDIAATSIELNP